LSTESIINFKKNKNTGMTKNIESLNLDKFLPGQGTGKAVSSSHPPLTDSPAGLTIAGYFSYSHSVSHVRTASGSSWAHHSFTGDDGSDWGDYWTAE
jgi:hypothetical protein